MMRSFIVIATTLVTGSAWSQTLTSVSPSSADRGDQLTVTISGNGTFFSQATNTIFFQQGSSTIYALSYTAQSNTIVEAEFQITLLAPCGLYSANVYSDPYGLLSLPSSFEVLCNQSLISVSPDSAERGEQLTVTITGNGTFFSQASNTIFFQQGSSTILALSYSAVSDTELEAEFDIVLTDSCGMYSTNVFNAINGLLSLPSSFEVKCEGIGIQRLRYATWKDFVLHPVPAREFVMISFADEPGTQLHITLFAPDARVIREFNDVTDRTLRLDASDMPRGIYLVKVTDGLHAVTRRFIKL